MRATALLSLFLLLLTACRTTEGPTPIPESTISTTSSTVTLGTSRDPAAVEAPRFRAQRLTVGSNLTAVATADIDGDGHLDLIMASDDGPIFLFRGDGSGTLTEVGRLEGGQQPSDLALEDLDGDGAVDIVIPNHDTQEITIFRGDGAFGFDHAPNSPLRVDVSPHVHLVRVADFDGDGILDMLVDDRDGGAVRILRGLGDGEFDSEATRVAVGGDPYLVIAVGDLDANGTPDLVTPNPTDVAVLLNRGPAALDFETVTTLAAGGPFAVALADLNGDGAPDIVAALDESSAQVRAYLGDGRGGFEEAAGSPYEVGRGGKNVAAGDFNGDGHGDVAISAFRSPDVLVLVGDPETPRVIRLPGGTSPWPLAAADLNEDGRDDLIVVDAASDQITIHLSDEG